MYTKSRRNEIVDTIEPYHDSIRNKKGLINIAGSAIKFLFGNPNKRLGRTRRQGQRNQHGAKEVCYHHSSRGYNSQHHELAKRFSCPYHMNPPYLVISEDGLKYRSLHFGEMQQCRGKSIKICPSHKAINTDPQSSCLSGFYRNEKEIVNHQCHKLYQRNPSAVYCRIICRYE